MSAPMVSVLMTAYNREEYIGDAIKSVLDSSYTDFELIIVDDRSSDNTFTIAKMYAAKDSRVKLYLNDQNLGDYPNRNVAAIYATGKYLKYLDSDDLIYKHGLQVMVENMEQFPGAGFGVRRDDADVRIVPVCLEPHEAYLEHFYKYSHFGRPPSSSIILRQAFNNVGGFSGKRMIGDFEFWLKIARSYKMVLMHQDLYWYREHENQEQSSAYAKKNYPILIKETIKEALDNKECPLSEDEKVKVITKISRDKSYPFRIFNKIKNKIR